MDIEVIGKIATTERSRKTWSAPRRKGVKAAQISGPRPPERISKKPGPKDQEPQGTAEDREPATLVPRVQITARRLLGLLRQGEQPCTRPPALQGI